MAGLQKSIRRLTCPEDDDRDNVDEHRDGDNDDDDDDHHGAFPKDNDRDNVDKHRDNNNDDDNDDRTFWYVVAGIGVVANGGRADCCGRSQRWPSENKQSGGGNVWLQEISAHFFPVTDNLLM